MANKKRLVTLVMSIALLLAVTVGGTLAYLQDTDMTSTS